MHAVNNARWMSLLGYCIAIRSISIAALLVLQWNVVDLV